MLHIMKLAVGARDVGHMRHFQAQRVANDPPLRHKTRNFPRRAPEILRGGSMYWVVAGVVMVRQGIIDIVPDTRDDGAACAALLLHPELIPVAGRPVKAFQGWRYLTVADAPPDLTALDGSGVAELPAKMQHELRRLGLL